MESDDLRRERRLPHLMRMGEGKARDDFAIHREILHPDFRDYRLGAGESVVGVDA